MASHPDFRALLATTPSIVDVEAERWLRAERPGQAVVCTELHTFNVDVFCAEGQCTLERDEALTVRRWWWDDNEVLAPSTVQGWVRVTWQDHAFDVLTLSWNGDGCSRDTVHWVAGPTLVAVRDFVTAVCRWNDQAAGGLLVYEHGEWRRSRTLKRSIEASSFEQLVLGGGLKEAVRDDVRRFFARKDFYDAHQVAWRRGLLFLGPPGNGKTHTIRALLHEVGGNAVYVRSFRGQRRTDEQNMADVFARARRVAPCVLVLEDLDCLVSETTRSSLLNELDGLTSNRGILTIATTNHPEKLDRSLLDRPSRFDRKFHFPVPEPAERQAFLDAWCQRLHDELRPSPAAVEAAVEHTGGFTFAYLKELLVSTTTRWVGETSPPPVDDLLGQQVDALRREMKSVVETHGTFLDGPRRIGL